MQEYLCPTTMKPCENIKELCSTTCYLTQKMPEGITISFSQPSKPEHVGKEAIDVEQAAKAFYSRTYSEAPSKTAFFIAGAKWAEQGKQEAPGDEQPTYEELSNLWRDIDLITDHADFGPAEKYKMIDKRINEFNKTIKL